AELEGIINRALEKDRELRYQHASEMRAELQRLKRDTESGRRIVADEPPEAGAAVSSQRSGPRSSSPSNQRPSGSAEAVRSSSSSSLSASRAGAPAPHEPVEL